MGILLVGIVILGSIWATTPWWPDHWFRLPLMYKPKEDLREPILPSELDDWDAEFTRLTGKTIWQARCEADPELCKSLYELGSAQNNINPYYQESALLAQAMNLQQQQLAAQQQNSQLSGLLGGLGSSLGGLFH